MFTEKDTIQIQSKGLTIEDIEKQIAFFKKGFPYIKLVAPATPGNGLNKYTENEINELVRYFVKHRNDYSIIKFVPASGAASRMFKHLFEFREKYADTKPDPAEIEQNKSYNDVHQFFKNLKLFAFYDELEALLENKGYSVGNLLNSGDHHIILDYLLSEIGLNYANLPKGLLSFHSYEKNSRLAVEEHLVESAVYATDSQNKSYLHLTVSPEHIEKFKEAISKRKKLYEKLFDVTIHISYSQQKPSTDIIAVDLDNNPFRLENGNLLFRPGGHGALIENLNDLDADIVFIKNIDNVVPDQLRDTTYTYKKAIGGLLLQLQEKTFEFLDMLDNGHLTDEELENIKVFAKKELNIFIPDAYKGYDHMERIDFLYNKLNRPIRVCGMVKNEGEPGGGPFWVQNESEELSLQIVESSQMDLSNPQQQKIVNKATHFNPVDLVCGIRNHKGKKFDLKEYVDQNTGFISQKSQNGKELKAQELPGLWNGAMADWITIFVETPIITFNPVKTINDLLRTEHQSQ
jgi:hypothetical protein